MDFGPQGIGREPVLHTHNHAPLKAAIGSRGRCLHAAMLHIATAAKLTRPDACQTLHLQVNREVPQTRGYQGKKGVKTVASRKRSGNGLGFRVKENFNRRSKATLRLFFISWGSRRSMKCIDHWLSHRKIFYALKKLQCYSVLKFFHILCCRLFLKWIKFNHFPQFCNRTP